MECNIACQQMSGWIDGQLSPTEVAAFEDHLLACAECRSTVDAFRAQDADLREVFQPHRQAASRLAAEVLQLLHTEPIGGQPLTSQARLRWDALLLAAAAGFLLAVVLFQPWKQRAVATHPPKVVAPVQQPTEPPVAQLVLATGNVDIRARHAAGWQACSDPVGFQCAGGSVLRTGPDVRCELKTADGCIIRLNNDTEITLASPNAIEIQKGQIWCSSPENVSLKICAPQAGMSAQQSTEPPWFMACPSHSSLITEVRRDGDMQVITADGEAQLQTPKDSQRLKRGESASIVAGQIVKSPGSIDPILAAGWMHSLLIQKGRGNDELAGRIDQLLARLGHSKVTLLYEQEIRALGEFAVLPLLRYVQSPISREDPQRRLTAMRILSDIATSSTVSDLIKLLADENADTRVLAAQSLQRLTGLDQGRSPEQWREDPNAIAPTIERWRQWWDKNSQQYPPPITTRPGERSPSSA